MVSMGISNVLHTAAAAASKQCIFSSIAEESKNMSTTSFVCTTKHVVQCTCDAPYCYSNRLASKPKGTRVIRGSLLRERGSERATDRQRETFGEKHYDS